MQNDLQALEFACQIGIEDGIAGRSRHRIDDGQLVNPDCRNH